MNHEELIGKQIKAFKFPDKIKLLRYNSQMDEIIGQIGTIINYDPNTDSYRTEFLSSGAWYYPASLIEKHIYEPPIEDVTEELKELLTQIKKL